MVELPRESPEPALRFFAPLPSTRVLVIGGDGTVAWILSCVDALAAELGGSCPTPHSQGLGSGGTPGSPGPPIAGGVGGAAGLNGGGGGGGGLSPIGASPVGGGSGAAGAAGGGSAAHTPSGHGGGSAAGAGPGPGVGAGAGALVPSWHSPPVAVFPVGTGNDLARCLNWGGGLRQLQRSTLPTLLEEVAFAAAPTQLDRWNVNITPHRPLPPARYKRLKQLFKKRGSTSGAAAAGGGSGGAGRASVSGGAGTPRGGGGGGSGGGAAAASGGVTGGAGGEHQYLSKALTLTGHGALAPSAKVMNNYVGIGIDAKVRGQGGSAGGWCRGRVAKVLCCKGRGNSGQLRFGLRCICRV